MTIVNILTGLLFEKKPLMWQENEKYVLWLFENFL